MGIKEPVRGSGRLKFVSVAKFALGCQAMIAICSCGVMAGDIISIGLAKNITNIFSTATGWHPMSAASLDFSSLVQKAQLTVKNHPDLKGLFTDGAVKFDAHRALTDSFSTTIKFKQSYKGLEVVGHDAIVHFDADGEVHDVSGNAITADLSTEPTVSLDTAHQLLDAHAGEHAELTEASQLQILKDFSGKAHLAYRFLTRTSPTYAGEELFLDAHSGQVVMAFPRALDVTPVKNGARTVYMADTPDAQEHVDERGYPTDINLSWYVKALEDGKKGDRADQTATNAYNNAGLTYAYYQTHFNRRSYDDNDGRLVSIVHVGTKMNNAFWTNEYKVMCYGDGDGTHLTDTTADLDVGAHELTHGVTGQTANLVYLGESGALNESYSDFFGKMVANDGNWDIGRGIMAKSWGRRALRNMENPEEFKQPGSSTSPYKIPTDGDCTGENDHCGVHTNSGIPSKAAVLIYNALGKQKVEQLYYKVLTSRLSRTSNFHDARTQTEQECSQMFGAGSADCKAVTAAFDQVGM